MRITKHLILLGGVLVVATACTDETLQKIDIEKNRGKEVSFTASAQPFTENTRTYYGTPTNGKCPIFWSSKDNIVVASPMGQPGRDNAVYSIEVPVGSNGKPEEEGAYYAKNIVLNTNVNQAGVQWGDDPKNGSFYSIYPYSAETLRQPGGSLQNVDHNSITLDDNGKVTATAKIEAEQRIWAPVGTEAKSVTVGSGDDASTYELLNMYGSNHALVMWAQTDNVAHGESVNLRFSPLSTCLMMTFSCTKEIGGDANFPAIVEEITIQADTEIAGDMLITFPDPNEETEATGITGTNQKYNIGTPECTLLNNENASNKIVIVPHILSTDMPSGYSPIIGYGQKMQICAFLFPKKGGYNMSNWTITAKINGKLYSRKMTPENDSEDNHTILPGQVHQIEFPSFNVTEEWDFNPNSWMADIPDNTYLSQITFPGAWETMNQDTDDYDLEYQSASYKTLIECGIRAFDLKTRTYTNSTGVKSVIATGTLGQKAGGISVGEILVQMAQHVSAKANTETVVVVLRYEPDSGENGGSDPDDYAYWMKGLAQEYATANGRYSNILTVGEITPETTLDDVRGKIIIKVNIGDDVCENWAKSGSNMYENDLPALISYSPIRWVTNSDVVDLKGNPVDPEDFTDKSLTSVLQWKDWDGSWNSKLINELVADRPNLYAWNFSCTARTYKDEDKVVTNDIPSMGLRQEALDGLKIEANDVYNKGYHNEWFLFGCGGSYATSTTSAIQQSDVLSFTSAMNKWLYGQLEEIFITNTPCPLGIVFYNQVCGVDEDKEEDPVVGTIITLKPGFNNYDGLEILTSLIKMNKAFYLQQKPESTTPASAPRRTRAENSKSKTESNGWTVYRP